MPSESFRADPVDRFDGRQKHPKHTATAREWASPNTWGNGYRYGNVQFALDWAELIADKRFYWDEVMSYKPKACRILITDKDYDTDPELLPYDPAAGDGPWWWDKPRDTHYRNGNICLEFMLEFPADVSSCAEIRFVPHHDSYCCIDAAASELIPSVGRDGFVRLRSRAAPKLSHY